MKINIPPKVNLIIGRLMDAGFEAFAVGGCVRDSLLSRSPNDWDITTSALPVQVKELFGHTVDTGIQHGTVTVIIDGEGFEVTTYRIDGEYEDSRHPKEVTFTPNLEDDLARRDFTVNAMAYNDEAGLVDIFGGEQDLQKGIIRCVGNPNERFDEDALRVLRGVRFASQLGFEIAAGTLSAIEEKAPNLANISAERIQAELVKLLMSPHPDMMRQLYTLGITRVVLPEFDEMMETPQNNLHHIYNVGEHTLHSLTEVADKRELRLAVLFHDVAKPDTNEVDSEGISHFYNHAIEGEKKVQVILRRLKFDNDTINRVRRLIRWHDYRFNLSEKSMRHSISKIGADIFTDLLEVMRADVMGQSSYLQKEKLSELVKIRELYDYIIEKQQCLSVKDLAVNGRDIMALGVSKGPEIGKILSALLEIVLDEPKYNERGLLIEKAVEIHAGMKRMIF